MIKFIKRYVEHQQTKKLNEALRKRIQLQKILTKLELDEKKKTN
jgi:hypothetical protein